MKNRMGKSIVSITALIAASASMTTYASDNPALDRCVQMFVEEVVPANYSREIKREDIVASIRKINSSQSRVMLIAQGEKYEKLFGRGSCVMDRSGQLVAIYLYDTRPGRAAYGRPKVLARNIDATQGARTASNDTKPF